MGEPSLPSSVPCCACGHPDIGHCLPARPPSCPPAYLIDKKYGDFREVYEQQFSADHHQRVCEQLRALLSSRQQEPRTKLQRSYLRAKYRKVERRDENEGKSREASGHSKRCRGLDDISEDERRGVTRVRKQSFGARQRTSPLEEKGQRLAKTWAQSQSSSGAQGNSVRLLARLATESQADFPRAWTIGRQQRMRLRSLTSRVLLVEANELGCEGQNVHYQGQIHAEQDSDKHNYVSSLPAAITDLGTLQMSLSRSICPIYDRTAALQQSEVHLISLSTTPPTLANENGDDDLGCWVTRFDYMESLVYK